MELTTKEDLPTFIRRAGAILEVAYPVLALSTAFRAAYQLYEGQLSNAPWLSLLASLFYFLASFGFRKPVKWAWNLSVGVLLLETAFTLVIGALSMIQPELIGRNVWTLFGRDYGFFPLIQPLLGLAWLFHPATRKIYQ